MLVCFDKKGVLKEQLDSYGNLPRVGSQLFKIFAYFKDIDIDAYGSAYIRLERPDFEGSEYPILFMTQANLVFEDGIADGGSEYFALEAGPNADGTYPCYLFDFSTIVDTKGTETEGDDSIVKLLDTPGQWKATITLLSSAAGAANVVGTITFNVGGEAEYEEETVIDFDVISHNWGAVLAQKLNVNSPLYIRLVDNFETVAPSGTLLKEFFGIGKVIFDSVQRTFFKITNVAPVPNDDLHIIVTAYSEILNLNDKLDIVSSCVVVDDLDEALDNFFVVNQLFYVRELGAYYKKTANGMVLAENVGLLGSKNALVRYVITQNTTIGDIKGIIAPLKALLVNYGTKDYFLEFEEVEEDVFKVNALDVYNKCFYEVEGISSESTISSLLVSENRIDFVQRQVLPSSIYGINGFGQQTNILISDLLEGYTKFYEIPDLQTTVSFISDIIININGYVVPDCAYEPFTYGNYSGYKITTTGGENVSKEEAKAYLRAMTGSDYLPEYEYEKPNNSFMIMPDGTILKPQWDNTNGLILYKSKRIADTDYVDNHILILSTSGATLTDEQYAYVLIKHARALNSATGVFYEKYLEDSTKILFKAIDAVVNINNGVLTFKNDSALVINKTSKRYDFGAGAEQQSYSKSKLDADFATKDYVAEEVEKVRQNSLQNVDTEEYPTLEDFLASEGEEGIIYLYPVDLTDLDKGFYRYIWEYVKADDAYEWEYLGTTQIDLSEFEIMFEEASFADGNVSVAFKSNTDFKLISLVDTLSVQMTIPSNISQGWVSSCTFTVGNVIPTFSLVNNSNFNVVFIVNNRKAEVSGIALNLEPNGIVECMAECNGFDIRVYMKEVTN